MKNLSAQSVEEAVCRVFRAPLVAALFVVTFAGASQAASYNFDFSDYFGVASSSYAAAGEEGSWNVPLSGAIPSSGVQAESTSKSGVSVSIQAGNLSGKWAGGDKNLRPLIGDHFHTEGGGWRLGVSGIANGAYSVILYAPVHPFVVLGNGAVNGQQFNSVLGGHVLSEGESHVKLTGVLVTDGILNVNATSIRTGFNYAGLSGMQLIGSSGLSNISEVPLPASVLILLSGLGALVLFRRK